MTASEERSVGLMTFAMLRVTKISPGARPVMVSAGTRESEHPIHKIFGACDLARVGRKSGLSDFSLADHALLFSRARLKGSAAVEEDGAVDVSVFKLDKYADIQ